MSRVLSDLRKFISRLRMNALGYRYEYNRAIDEKIISDIWTEMHTSLQKPDGRQRRFSRAMAQYRAHLAMRPRVSVWTFEIASFFVLPFFLLGCWATYVLQGGSRDSRALDGLQLVFASRWKNNPEIFVVPDGLTGKSIATQPLDHHRLSSNDSVLILQLLAQSIAQRTPFPFQLALKCAVDVAAVRGAVMRYSPKFILVYWEFSCGLSIITQAMNACGIETYNVMHGDKHYYAKHAFFEVDRCYCWNEYYADLFREEHARSDFQCFTNPGFVLSTAERAHLDNHQPCGVGIAAPHIATLVSQKDSREGAAVQFADAINRLAKTNNVTIRAHPFYADDFNTIRPGLSSDVKIESPDSKPARTFLLDHKIIVGTVSTLLLDAAHLGCQVVAISTAVMKDVEQYHYLYTLENVTTSTLEDLSETIAAIDAKTKVGQTSIASHASS
ncbi:MAG: hypothetical protein P8L79_10075 [Rhodospirillaceae bacterium]|nr:hypothetical protein [Rhodospirillaceae bacterium]